MVGDFYEFIGGVYVDAATVQYRCICWTIRRLHYIGCVECTLVINISPNSNWLGLGISIENLSFSALRLIVID